MSKKAAVIAVIAIGGLSAAGQTVQPVNDLPNPYTTVADYFKLPAGRTWGSTSAVDVDKDGRSIWVAERCGLNTCFDRATGTMSPLDPILKFDATGKLVKSFGAGMLVFPHGIHVDRDGNIWVTDGNDNQPLPPGRGRGGDTAPATPPPPAKTPVGHQVFKFSPEGKLIMTLGKAGVRGNPPDALTEPNDVIVAPNGTILVAEGHGGQNANATPDTVARISIFTRDGQYIRSFGKLGSAPGEFRTPHGLAFDSRNRLFVADRGNVRIQVFDQEGRFLEETKQFSRLSGIAIRNDVLYGADSESTDASNKGWRRGMRIGPIKEMKPMYFIPDPDLKATGTSAAEGVAVDAAGNVYGAEVGPRALKKYVKK